MGYMSVSALTVGDKRIEWGENADRKVKKRKKGRMHGSLPPGPRW
jgi:hypothetical protein